MVFATLSHVFDNFLGYIYVTFCVRCCVTVWVRYGVNFLFNGTLPLRSLLCHIIPSLQVTFHLPAYWPHTILHWQIQCRHRAKSVFQHRDMKGDSCFSNHTKTLQRIMHSLKLVSVVPLFFHSSFLPCHVIGASSHMYGLEPIFVISSKSPNAFASVICIWSLIEWYDPSLIPRPSTAKRLYISVTVTR